MRYSPKTIAETIYWQTVEELHGTRLVKDRIGISHETDGAFSLHFGETFYVPSRERLWICGSGWFRA